VAKKYVSISRERAYYRNLFTLRLHRYDSEFSNTSMYNCIAQLLIINHIKI